MITQPAIGVEILYIVGRVEIGWGDDLRPVMRDTRTGSIARGTRAVFFHADLKQCATDWDNRLNEADRLARSILGDDGFGKLSKLYGIGGAA